MKPISLVITRQGTSTSGPTNPLRADSATDVMMIVRELFRICEYGWWDERNSDIEVSANTTVRSAKYQPPRRPPDKNQGRRPEKEETEEQRPAACRTWLLDLVVRLERAAHVGGHGAGRLGEKTYEDAARIGVVRIECKRAAHLGHRLRASARFLGGIGRAEDTLGESARA